MSIIILSSNRNQAIPSTMIELVLVSRIEEIGTYINRTNDIPSNPRATKLIKSASMMIYTVSLWVFCRKRAHSLVWSESLPTGCKLTKHVKSTAYAIALIMDKEGGFLEGIMNNFKRTRTGHDRIYGCILFISIFVLLIIINSNSIYNKRQLIKHGLMRFFSYVFSTNFG